MSLTPVAVVSTSNGSSKTIVSNTSATSIEDLYKYFGVLADAKEDAGKHAETYLKIISGTKGGVKEKQLSSQFITRFFKYFPKEMPIAIDAIFDLCEDEDVTIRKAAIKDLAVLCKDCAVEHLNRIADILTQLLQTDDQSEFSQVQTSLLVVFRQDPKATLSEIFNQINTADLEEVRKRAIKFLVTKIPILIEQNQNNPLFNKDFEDLVVKHVKQVLIDVDAEEFILFIKLLTSLPSMNTLIGRQDLVNIIMAQSELDKPFDANDIERLMILLSCMQQAIPLFSKNVQSTKYVSYYMDNVLSVFAKLTDENIKFEILKAFAELCSYFNGGFTTTLCSANLNMLPNLDYIYNLLIEYLPKSSETDAKTAEEQEEETFNFSYVECLIYAFHMLARFNPDYLAKEENKEKLKDFRLRLQHFAKGTQNYIKELRNSIVNSTAGKDNEQDKIRRVALKVTTNIDILIKDLFHNPPSYKSSITLSWKMEQAAAKRSLSVSSIDGEEGRKKLPERGIYHPPSGKYSTSTTTPPTTTNSSSSNGATNKNNKNTTNANGTKRRTFSNGAHQQFRFGAGNRF